MATAERWTKYAASHSIPTLRSTRAERRCEKVVAKLSAKFLRGALRDAKPAAALFADAVGNACPDDVVSAVAFGGECAGSDSTGALVRVSKNLSGLRQIAGDGNGQT